MKRKRLSIVLKRLFFFLLMYSSLSNLNAQDVIILLTGDEIFSEVIDLGHEEILYKMHDSLEGPTYSISNNEVFMVKYADGTKIVFRNSDGNSGACNYYRNDIKYEINEEYTSYLVEHKGKKVIYDYQIDTERVLSASRVYYYGIDMTSLVLLNPAKVGYEKGNEEYITAWVSYVNNWIPPDKYLKKWLRKDELIKKYDPIHERNLKKGGKWIDSECEGLPIEYVQELVHSYSENIEGISGIGFVIIMDCFNKRREEAIGIYCFFDIETGDVLWVAKTRGDAEGAGMTKHWAYGIVNSLKAFIDKVYKVELG